MKRGAIELTYKSYRCGVRVGAQSYRALFVVSCLLSRLSHSRMRAVSRRFADGSRAYFASLLVSSIYHLVNRAFDDRPSRLPIVNCL